ncbi:MAG TPA: DUF1549 domain-containing protein [Gemmataceae bacterium]|nr:DUF1549 domain-containing protein [Gemmataceae bacterium]
MVWARNLLFLGVVVGGLSALAANLLPPRKPARIHSYDAGEYSAPGFRAVVGEVDATFRQQWLSEGLKPANPAPDLLQARRLALGLMGTVPSLEEIRQLEALPADQRVPWYLDRILADSRFADYFGERLARAYVGTEDGPFIFYRRRRFVTWLSEQVAVNRPYDQIVRELIAGDGLWTDHPATNFVSVTVQNDKQNQPDPVRLAGRVTRAFLGMRLDCAQCHNHPFTEWKQADFQGLAAFFGQTHVGFRGIQDGNGEFKAEDRYSKAEKVIDPMVPFLRELLPDRGERRDRLAAWVTHPKNPYFARAAVNRVWALMTGRPLVEPVDNLEPGAQFPPALQILADDFAAHGFDLRRLIRLIASTAVSRLDSAAEHEIGESEERAWAVFPLTRLRPEQVAGSVLQSASVSTLDSRTHILFRLAKLGQQNEFVQRYGDTGEDEFTGRGGTIPQRLLLMNGKVVREKVGQNPMNASTRIAWVASTDAKAVEVAYLAVLSRRPTPEERAHFEQFLADKSEGRPQKLEDLYWALVNSTEFSWNH